MKICEKSWIFTIGSWEIWVSIQATPQVMRRPTRRICTRSSSQARSGSAKGCEVSQSPELFHCGRAIAFDKHFLKLPALGPCLRRIPARCIFRGAFLSPQVLLRQGEAGSKPLPHREELRERVSAWVEEAKNEVRTELELFCNFIRVCRHF